MATARRWTILAVGTFAQAATSSFLYGIPMLVPALRRQDGLSLFAASLLVSAPIVGAPTDARWSFSVWSMSSWTADCVGSAVVVLSASAERAFRPTVGSARSRASAARVSFLIHQGQRSRSRRRYRVVTEEGTRTSTKVRPAPPARGAAVTGSELLLLRLLLRGLLGSLLLRRHLGHLPSSKSDRRVQRSEQPSLPPGLATGLAGASEPFLEFASRDAPDPTDPDRGNALRIRVVHCAEAAQDGRGVNAQALRHFVGREELV